MSPWRLLLLTACLAVPLSASVGEEPPKGVKGKPARGKPTRTDLYGDPLPPGAVARLGTVRLRHPDRVKAATFSPDGKVLASSSGRGVVCLWEALSGRALHQIRTGSWYVYALAFSPDGKTLAAGGDAVTLWEVSTGRQLFRCKDAEHEDYRALAFAPDGKSLASGSWGARVTEGGRTWDQESAVCLWDPATGRKLLRLRGHGDRVEGVAFSPDGATLASTSRDKAVHLWDVKNGKALRPLKGNQHPMCRVAFSPDGKTLASGDWEGDVVLWDLAKGVEARRLRAHRQSIASLSFTPDGKTLATGAEYSAVRLWDPRTAKERPGIGPLARVAWMGAFSPDGKTLAVWGEDHVVHFWDVAGKVKHGADGHGSSVLSAAVSPDSRTVASASWDGVRLWEVATGRQLRWLRGHDGEGVRCVAFSLDGKALASGGGDGTVHLWDAATGKVIRQVKTGERIVFAVGFSPDGQLFYSVGFFLVRVWDRATGKAIHQFGQIPALHTFRSGRLPPSPSLAVSPDGRTLAILASGELRLWGALTGKEISTAPGFRSAGVPLAFSPDGRVLASSRHNGLTDSVISLWEVATGKERLRLSKAKPSYRGFRFSSDWRGLAVTCDDGSVRLLRTATGEEARVFPGHKDGVEGIVYAPNGRFLVTRSHDTSMLVWDVSEALGKAAPLPMLPRGLKGLWQKPSPSSDPKRGETRWRGAVVFPALSAGLAVALCIAIGWAGRLTRRVKG